MTEALDLLTATPAQIDDALFPLWAERWALTDRVVSYRSTIAATLFPGSIRRFTNRGYEIVRGISTVQLRQWDDLLVKAQENLEVVKAAIAPIDAEYVRRGGWDRYILVGGGHLHKSGCSTVRPTTQAYLLAEASGLTEDEVVEKYSYTACTKCFPNAPVAEKPSPVAQGFCAGSGTWDVEDVNGSKRLYRPWGRCKHCGNTVSVTSTGKARKHKEKS
jgi:hypothetical protein